jgi:hypothetical protein
MVLYKMRVKWLKDFKYLSITLSEVEETAEGPRIKPLINNFTESLSRELNSRLGGLREAQMLSLLDSRIREVIIESLESQVVGPVKRRMRELQVYCKSGIKPEPQTTIREVAAEMKKIQKE